MSDGKWWIRKKFLGGWECIDKPYGDERNRMLNISDKWIEVCDDRIDGFELLEIANEEIKRLKEYIEKLEVGNDQ